MLDANAARTFVQPRLNAAPAGKAAAILLTLLLAGCSDMQSIHDSSHLQTPLQAAQNNFFAAT